jgi:hypothetical protein
MTNNSILLIGILVLLVVLWPVIRRILKLFLFRTAVRVALQDVGDKALARQIDQVHLVKKDVFYGDQLDAEREALAEPLLSRGFTRVGLFDIPEMPGVDIYQLVNVNTNVYANLYSHPKAGKWTELVSRYQDGVFCSFSTQVSRGLDHRPGDVHVSAPGCDPGELYDRMLRERPQPGALVELTSDEVPRLFEKGYAELMFWRKNKGISPEEVARVAVSLKKNPIGKPASSGR